MRVAAHSRRQTSPVAISESIWSRATLAVRAGLNLMGPCSLGRCPAQAVPSASSYNTGMSALKLRGATASKAIARAITESLARRRSSAV